MDESKPARQSKVQQIVALTANIVTIAVFVVPLLIGWLSRAPVTIEVDSTPSTIPPYLSSRLIEMTNAVRTDKRASDTFGNTLRDLSQRLLRVRAVQRITLTNRSTSTIKDLSARVPNVWKAEFFSVQCDTCTQAEKDSILDLCKFDTFSNHVVIGPIPKVPPKSTILISIFGDFGAGLGPAATASYVDGDARLVKPEKVEGLEAVIARLGPFGFLVLALLFAGQQLLQRTKWRTDGT